MPPTRGTYLVLLLFHQQSALPDDSHHRLKTKWEEMENGLLSWMSILDSQQLVQRSSAGRRNKSAKPLNWKLNRCSNCLGSLDELEFSPATTTEPWTYLQSIPIFVYYSRISIIIKHLLWCPSSSSHHHREEAGKYICKRGKCTKLASRGDYPTNTERISRGAAKNPFKQTVLIENYYNCGSIFTPFLWRL